MLSFYYIYIPYYNNLILKVLLNNFISSRYYGQIKYRCKVYKKKFGRRYNVDRHSLRKHDGMAIIFNKETNEISNKRKINDYSPSPSSSPITTTTTTTKTEANNNIRTIPDPHDNNHEDFFSNPDSKINNSTADKEKIFRIFEKISPLIDELDLLLLKHKPDPERKQILSNVIGLSLATSTPVRSLKDTINFYRVTKGMEKATSYVAESQNITPNQAKEMLKSIILAVPYSRDKFNNKLFIQTN
ncbi:MAG TPA: hypothetical protein VGC75_02535 [Candidatus Nitrosocosmicus sp.]